MNDSEIKYYDFTMDFVRGADFIATRANTEMLVKVVRSLNLSPRLTLKFDDFYTRPVSINEVDISDLRNSMYPIFISDVVIVKHEGEQKIIKNRFGMEESINKIEIIDYEAMKAARKLTLKENYWLKSIAKYF